MAEEEQVNLLNPAANPVQTEVTYSIVEIPRGQSSSNESTFDQSSEKCEAAPCKYHENQVN